MFTRLRTKLTVLYAALFGAALILVAAVVNGMIAENAARSVRQELVANGAVFDRVWELRESQLRDSAAILGGDFGFREAVATADGPTIASALVNLRDRLDIGRAMVMTLDGEIFDADETAWTDNDLDRLWTALDQGARSGVLTLGGKPHQAVAAPIRAPGLIGWIVFAAELDRAQLTELESLSAIPLRAEVFVRAPDATWSAENDAKGQSAAVNALLDSPGEGATKLPGRTGAEIALAKPLQAFTGDDQAALLLRYPLHLALRPYTPLLWTIAGIGVLGVGLLAFGSWALAGTLTRPIASLDEAARALTKGARAHVAIETADEIGRLARSFNVMSDEIAERERKITHMALHDPETDLPNRRRLERAIGEAGAGAFVAVLSVDRYQTIRSAIGYALTGQLVAELGAKIRAARPDWVLCRIGPDALALVLTTRSGEEAAAAALDLRSVAAGPLRVAETTVDVDLSVGLARIDHADDRAALERASIAVEQARAAYRPFCVFDPDLYGDPAQNLSLMSEMIDGINKGHLTLHYQPKHDLRRRAIVGVEALVRWAHPTRGRIAPDLFVTMAEETGHIGALTEWTLIEAIGEQRRLAQAGLDLVVSVNLSGRLLSDRRFTDLAIDLADDTGARLCLEITETAAMHDPDVAIEAIGRLSAAGIEVSIDDYGAGFSSLAYLKRIRARELKIDKSFIQSLAENQRDALLVKSTIDLAHGLDMKVTAEGVESPEIMAALAAMGCDVAQGYFIGKPMPARDLPPHLEDWARRCADVPRPVALAT